MSTTAVIPRAVHTKSVIATVSLPILFVASHAFGATFYVDNSGSPACSNSTSSGSQSNPWCTISYGLSRINGGDTLYVKAGTYNEGVTITGPAGTSAIPTIIRSYPGHSVTIRGAGVDSGRVKIENTSFITLDGFIITNFNQGIHINGSNHIVIQNNEVHHVGQEGIHAQFNSSFLTIQNNIIHDTRQWQYNGEGIYVGSGSTASPDNTNNVTIKGNTVYNTNDEGIELKPGTHDIIVDGNTVFNALIDSTYGNSVGSIEVNESSNVGGGNQSWSSDPKHIIRNNIIHSTKTAIRAGTGCTIYNNLIYGLVSPYYGIYVDNLVVDTYTRRIYHNTIDLPSSRAVVVSTGTTDIKNNIGPSTPNNIATSTAYFVNAASKDYHLISGSAPVNTGVDLSAIVATDIEGRSRSAVMPPDLGAYEAILASGGDSVPPSVPGSLTATALSSSTISLTWTASTDNIGVTGYWIYRNGNQHGTSSTTSYLDTGLSASTQYSYTVVAYDAASNMSNQSTAALATTQSSGGDISARSCSQTDVQAAINSASNGNTVTVPAGTCTWSTTVSTLGKAITLQGAGVDQTTVVSNITNAPSLSTGGISGGLIRVTGFTFNGNYKTKGGNHGEIDFGGSNGVDRFRFDHIKMVNLGNRGFYIREDGNAVGGLIDHFTCIKSTSDSVQCVTVDGSWPQSRAPFSRPLSLGTNKAIYIEDSTFTYAGENDGALDAYNGARYVFRHNSVTGTNIGHHGADSGDGAGMAGFEVYDNVITNPGPGSVSRIMFWRSGVGVVFNNTVSGTFSGGINVKNYRSCQSYSYWGQCNGSSSWDQNLPGQQGAACLDQVGHQFTENQGGSNILSPYYSWNNTKNGSRQDTAIESDCAAANVHMQLNREIYNSMSGFDGTSGMGVGRIADRPTTCTPITGYFATDTKTLYKCSSANTWTSYYTPYTYPHPLQGLTPLPLTTPGDLTVTNVR